MAAELSADIAADKTGTGLIFAVFYSELEKKAYYVTQDLEEIFISLGITEEEIKASKPLTRGLKKAIKALLDDYGNYSL